MIPAAHAVRAALVLKLLGKARRSHVMDLLFDDGVALAVGLNAHFPQVATAISAPTPGLVQVFMKALGERPSRERSLRCNAVSSGSNRRTTRPVWQSR